MSPRYAGSPRRWHRNREASELASLRQRTLLYPISAPATWRHQRGFTATATSQATATATSQATATATATVAARETATATATATVAARNGNCNGRCAGKGNRSARMKPLSGRRLLTASMLTGLAQPNPRRRGGCGRQAIATVRVLGFAAQPTPSIWPWIGHRHHSRESPTYAFCMPCRHPDNFDSHQGF